MNQSAPATIRPYRAALAPFVVAYGWLILAGRTLQAVLLLVFRLYWGWEFFITGKGKLEHISHVIGFFTQLGIPLPTVNAWFVSILEMVGGLMLLVGFGARPIAFMLAIDMVVAYITADHRALAGIFSHAGRFFAATPFLFLLASVLIFAFGPGLFSIDALLKRLIFDPRAKRRGTLSDEQAQSAPHLHRN